MIPGGTCIAVRRPRGNATADVQGEVKRSDNKDGRQIKTQTLTSAAQYLVAEGLLAGLEDLPQLQEKSYKAATVLIELPPLYRLIEKSSKKFIQIVVDFMHLSFTWPKRGAGDKLVVVDMHYCNKQHYRLRLFDQVMILEFLQDFSLQSAKRPGIQMLSVQPDTKPKGCAGCNRKIKDRYLLKALDKYWHEDCLKCACCDCRLGEVGSTLYTKANLILCRRDYLSDYHNPQHDIPPWPPGPGKAQSLSSAPGQAPCCRVYDVNQTSDTCNNLALFLSDRKDGYLYANPTYHYPKSNCW
ncbi:hypothetical protein BTVI_104535 [Pitangus sulphuratus]|nr:hypothetical protein BTVI_104535 [Pitangus sulphuratus]